jgi:hypothetical protein
MGYPIRKESEIKVIVLVEHPVRIPVMEQHVSPLQMIGSIF